jgi:MtrB/PioB family decaheme-associated outer membrane protein
MRLIAAVAAVLGAATVASAQTSIFGLQIDGEVELGGRIYIDRPSPEARAKLEEYRDLSEQPFGAFRLRLFRPDESYSTELGGRLIGQEDQEFFLSTGRTGLWRLEFDWNQIPHLLSTNARLLATEPSPGVFVLPDPRPPLATYNTPPFRDIETRWDVGTLAFTLTPTPDLDVLVQYTRIKKDGERPFGVAMSSPGGNFYEVLQPIDQTIHDARIRFAWSGESWQVQGGYTLSLFTNGDDAVVADNPCFRLSACAGDANGAQARSQSSLPPDNMAHTVWLAGAMNLPMRSRVAATASYTLRLQDDDFLPHTINPAISSPTLALPQSSLDGQVGTFLFNLNGTSRPLPPLTLSARYRLFDFDDMRDELVFPGHVVNDRTLVVEPRQAGQWSYMKQNADVDGRWRFGEPVALLVGGGWERWDRDEHREVATSDEYFAKVAVDVTPVDWLLGRLTYKPSFRRISDYETFAHLEHTVVEDEPTPSELAQGQSVLLRKFDEADRDRQRVDLLLQFTPTDAISFTPTVGYRDDDYYNSALGLQSAEAWSAGFDLSWVPADWLSVALGYTYEKISQQQRSRNREVSGATVVDPVDFDWISDNVDTVHTLYAGLRAGLIPKVLDWVLNVSYSHATGEVNTSNPLPVTSGTPAQRSNATAKPFPDFTDSLFRVDTGFRYHFLKNWTAKLAYAFEKFTQSDFRTDTLNPFIPGQNSIWLGNDFKDYTAHIIVLALTYRFP